MHLTLRRRAVLWLSAALCAAGLCGCAGQPAAFTVNGLAVERAELIHYMQENSAVVAAALDNEGLDSFRDDFWTAPQNGVDTFARLRDYTIQAITRQKVEQLCARDEGIDTPLYYSEQQEQMQEQNRQRASAYAAGEVLYGPVERDFVSYFSEWYLAMQQQCRAALIQKGILTVSEDEVNAYYTAHKANFTSESREDACYRIREYLLDEAYTAYIDKLAAQASVKEGETRILPEEVF